MENKCLKGNIQSGSVEEPVKKPWFLYLLECANKSIYTGIAVDVAARYAQHASGKGAKYTRANKPRRLLAVVEYENQSAASKAEYQIKQLSASAKRAFCKTCNAQSI